MTVKNDPLWLTAVLLAIVLGVMCAFLHDSPSMPAPPADCVPIDVVEKLLIACAHHPNCETLVRRYLLTPTPGVP